MKITPEAVATLSNENLAKSMILTAELLENFAQAGAPLSNAGPLCLMEASKRLKAQQAITVDAQLVADMTKRIYDAITPETIALGVEGLRKRLVAVLAAN